jgi:hypothetical protein
VDAWPTTRLAPFSTSVLASALARMSRSGVTSRDGTREAATREAATRSRTA